jgi:ribonucleoside-triphosphate reductase
MTAAPGSDNAARRSTYVGDLCRLGIDAAKRDVLASLAPPLRHLYETGGIHLHDLEAYGRVPNCLTPDWVKNVDATRYATASRARRIGLPFDILRHLITDMASEQTGGLGFIDFDQDLSDCYERLGISALGMGDEVLLSSLSSFLDWINTARTRYGLECYYVTLNVGLGLTTTARTVTKTILEFLRDRPWDFVRPNVVFKITPGINSEPTAPNHDLLGLAYDVCSSRMAPTFLLCAAAPHRDAKPSELAIMGCRTRVLANLHGRCGARGRGNLAYTSLNLPQISILATQNRSGETAVSAFRRILTHRTAVVVDGLMDRMTRLANRPASDFPASLRWEPWCEPFSSDGTMATAWSQGTLAVGFVGLAEAVQLLTGRNVCHDRGAWRMAYDTISLLRALVDGHKARLGVNMTLLATSAEYAAGRFAEIDAIHCSRTGGAGFYTNSFHVPVDCVVHPYRKLELEGPFHALCNGGSISYVELPSPPTGNREAIAELVDQATKSGVSYFGVNFPIDACRSCHTVGVFDTCQCGSTDILRIRRVSGYLEDLTHFTRGKRSEVARRQPFLEYEREG